ncbi:MAG: toll/interleukin-1 receptor domain-containing protein [Terricaulis sp.]|jgi:hypothetical protein
MFARFNAVRAFDTHIRAALEHGVANVPMRYVSPDRVFLLSVWAWAIYLRYAKIEEKGENRRAVEDAAFDHCVTPLERWAVSEIGIAGPLAAMGQRGLRHHLRPFFDLAVKRSADLGPQHISFSSGTFQTLVTQFRFFNATRQDLATVAAQLEIRALGFAGVRLQAFLYERLVGERIAGDILPESMDDVSPAVEVFVSYAHEDVAAARRIVDFLKSCGRQVFFDEQMTGTRAFNTNITDTVRTAGVVIVLWSRHSIVSRWVNAEALSAFDSHRLVNVLLEDVKIPLPFNAAQALTLSGGGEAAHEMLGQVVDRLLQGVGVR